MRAESLSQQYTNYTHSSFELHSKYYTTVQLDCRKCTRCVTSDAVFIVSLLLAGVLAETILVRLSCMLCSFAHPLNTFVHILGTHC
ncbi:hypothetical protein KCV07_g429, partial [Aureobasidium melanogenum]